MSLTEELTEELLLKMIKVGLVQPLDIQTEIIQMTRRAATAYDFDQAMDMGPLYSQVKRVRTSPSTSPDRDTRSACTTSGVISSGTASAANSSWRNRTGLKYQRQVSLVVEGTEWRLKSVEFQPGPGRAGTKFECLSAAAKALQNAQFPELHLKDLIHGHLRAAGVKGASVSVGRSKLGLKYPSAEEALCAARKVYLSTFPENTSYGSGGAGGHSKACIAEFDAFVERIRKNACTLASKVCASIRERAKNELEARRNGNGKRVLVHHQ